VVSIRFFNGFWTIFCGEQPVLTCTSFERALALSVATLVAQP